MMHHRAKLPFATVQAIRYQREQHGKSFRQLAREFGVSMWTVRDLVEYRTRVSA